MLTFWKTTEELCFLKEVDKFALQNSLRNLKKAFTNMKGGSGYPNYKSKHDHYDSYTTQPTNNNISVDNTYIKLPKLGHVRYRDKKTPRGKICNATISRTPSGRFYASVCVETDDIKVLQMTDGRIGIDLGIKDFCAMSNHEKIENPHFLENALQKKKRPKENCLEKQKAVPIGKRIVSGLQDCTKKQQIKKEIFLKNCQPESSARMISYASRI